MAEKIFTPEEQKKYEEQAHRKGFETLRAYILSFMEKDAALDNEPGTTNTNSDLIDPIESFKKGWAQAMRGDVLTEEEFWKAVSDDD